MLLFIPTIGVRLALMSEARVKVYFEDRNTKLLRQFGVYCHNQYYSGTLTAKFDEKQMAKYGAEKGDGYVWLTLPVGSVLSVDRIYIRKSVSDFDSLTFNLMTRAGKEKNSFPYGRFWLKLEDVNTLDVEIVRDVEDVKADREKKKQREIEKQLKQREILVHKVCFLSALLAKHQRERILTSDDLESCHECRLEQLFREKRLELMNYFSGLEIDRMIVAELES